MRVLALLSGFSGTGSAAHTTLKLRGVALPLALLLSGCGSSEEVDSYDAFVKHVQNNRIGKDVDQWIEMKNMMGEWERTGLIFGYYGDDEECQNAISGLRQTNYQREYRCSPAN